MPGSEAVRKEFFMRMRNMWVPTNVTVVHTYYRMTRRGETVDATKAWPEEDRLPKERWPRYVDPDNSGESDDSEGEFVFDTLRLRSL